MTEIIMWALLWAGCSLLAVFIIGGVIRFGSRDEPAPEGFEQVESGGCAPPVLASTEPGPRQVKVSDTTYGLIQQLIERDQRGREKYGTTLDRTDLSLEDWLQHQVEENLDAAGYASAALRTLRTPAPTSLVDDELLDRVEAALQRHVDGSAPRRIPVDLTDSDLVLDDVRRARRGEPLGFWASPTNNNDAQEARHDA